MTRPGVTLAAFAAAALSLGCRDLDRFSTTDGESYCGNVVTSSFVRSSGFVPSARMRLTLDASELSANPGTLWTDDADDETGAGNCAPQSTFDGAKLRTVDKLFHDPLSTLDFGDGREHNFMAWAETTCGGQMLAVVSLMRNDDVEVRLLSPFEVNDNGESKAEFAVFPLTRKQGTCGF